MAPLLLPEDFLLSLGAYVLTRDFSSSLRLTAWEMGLSHLVVCAHQSKPSVLLKNLKGSPPPPSI